MAMFTWKGRWLCRFCSPKSGETAVLFALKVLVASYSVSTLVHLMPGVVVPSTWAYWLELVLIQIMVPNASFIGHLAGILVGVLFVKGPLKLVMDLPYILLTGRMTPDPRIEMHEDMEEMDVLMPDEGKRRREYRHRLEKEIQDRQRFHVVSSSIFSHDDEDAAAAHNAAIRGSSSSSSSRLRSNYPLAPPSSGPPSFLRLDDLIEGPRTIRGGKGGGLMCDGAKEREKEGVEGKNVLRTHDWFNATPILWAEQVMQHSCNAGAGPAGLVQAGGWFSGPSYTYRSGVSGFREREQGSNGQDEDQDLNEALRRSRQDYEAEEEEQRHLQEALLRSSTTRGDPPTMSRSPTLEDMEELRRRRLARFRN
ncbi:unnamed protein product [Notodromas monacha]|uniref:Peptidase S54 rhomboid domain-containing protein n=1 Tax=Notodromas monacha TaxID=399045 RepID=A0A7R9BY59_9CRUS|nr:unnamed protein product [Notodromas monacha]CAG0922831.1 unnamed protein product [Notodromas monacha]